MTIPSVSGERVITIPYAPRSAFVPYHRAQSRFSCTVAHRRAGKTVARVNKLVRSAALAQLEAPRYGYLAPYYVQAKDIAWAYLKKYAAPILQATKGKINESELSVTLGHNGAVIRLYGAENIERLRGLYFDGIVADEAQDIAPSALTSVIMPALSDRKGWLDLSGTPKGWANLLGKVYRMALDDPDWYVQVLKASQTGLIDAAELAILRKNMPENEYEQEFECSFDAAITGAYYAKSLRDAEFDGRICGVPHDPALQVHTAWDLGVSDHTSIVFWQQAGREVRVIDYDEGTGQGLDYYARRVFGQDPDTKHRERWVYGTHNGPHDIGHRELGTGKSRWETAKGLGLTFNPMPMLPVKDGIDAVRMLLPRVWFDKRRATPLLDALKQYREKIDEKRGLALGPLHDWTSHPADAMRTMAVALQEPARREQEVQVHGHDEDDWMV